MKSAIKRVLVMLILFVFMLNIFFFTKNILIGNVSLDIQPSYSLNEKLSGNLRITIDGGDLIQKDTLINLELKRGEIIEASREIRFSEFLSGLIEPVEVINSTEICENITIEEVNENNETITRIEENCTNQIISDYYFNQAGSYHRNISELIDYTFTEAGDYILIFSVPSLSLSEQKTLIVEGGFSGQEFSALSNGTAVDESGNVYQCGDINQSGTYTMNQSIITAGTCFTILANNVILDMNGHNITGNDGIAGYGISVSGYNQTTIKNGGIYDFGESSSDGRGVYLLNNKNNNITNMTVSSNDHGIYLSSSSNNTLTSITTNSNYDDGIYFSSSSNNALISITANSNYIYGIALLSSNNSILINITSSSNSNYGLVLSSSSNNTLTSITTNSNKYGVYFISSSNNTLTNMSIWQCTGTGTQGCLYFSNANNNVILGGTINLSSSNLIYLQTNSNNNVLQNIELYQATKNDTFLTTTSVNNTFLNVSYNVSLESVASGSQLIRKWYLDLGALDSLNTALNSTNITGKNVSQTTIFSQLTNSSGSITRQESIEYINNGAASGLNRTYYTNYNITGTKTGYATNVTILNLTTNTVLNLTLPDNTAPTITLYSPATGTDYSGASYTVLFMYNVSDDSNIANCSAYVSGTRYGNTSAVSKTTNNSISASLFASSYTAYVNCTDSDNNIGNSSSVSFTITAPSSTTIASSGGGGGGSAIKLGKTYSITEAQIKEGYEQELASNDIIKFTFTSSVNGVNDSVSEIHTIKVIELDEKDKEVELEISSNPIKIKLKVGEEAKIDLNNDKWYDLLVKFVDIKSGKAVINSKIISEKIIGEEVVVIEEIQEGTETISEIEKPGKKNNLISILLWAVILMIVLIIAVISARRVMRIKGLIKLRKEIKNRIV